MSTALQQIAELRGGFFGGEVDDLFARMLAGVEATGKAGKLTITLDVTKGSGGTLNLVAKATDKTPEPKPDADVFWLDDASGRLTRDNPKQRKLPLREVVDRETGEIRSADDAPLPLKSAS